MKHSAVEEHIERVVPAGESPSSVVVEDEPADKLSTHHRTVNLRATYPLAHRAIFAQSFGYLLAFIGVLLLLRYGSSVSITPAAPQTEGAVQPVLLSAYDIAAYYTFWGGLLLISLRLLYGELFLMTFYYGVEARHFVISKGVLLRNRGSLHISHVTDIFLKRSPVELIFLLYTIQIANPSPENPVEISSLARRQAIALQDFLVNVVKETRVGVKMNGLTVNGESPAPKTLGP